MGNSWLGKQKMDGPHSPQGSADKNEGTEIAKKWRRARLFESGLNIIEVQLRKLKMTALVKL